MMSFKCDVCSLDLGYAEPNSAMVKASPQCLSSRDMNWLSEAERTMAGGSAFQSLMARTASVSSDS